MQILNNKMNPRFEDEVGDIIPDHAARRNEVFLCLNFDFECCSGLLLHHLVND